MKNIFNKILSTFKTKKVEIAGEWKGFYSYNDSSPEFSSNKIEFNIHISLEQVDTNFTGTIKEAEDGIPEIAEVYGSISGFKIEFSKKYQNFYEVDQFGNHTVHEGPQYVYYTGIYDNFKQKYSGHWRTRAIYEYADGTQSTQDTTGRWEMWKEPSKNI